MKLHMRGFPDAPVADYAEASRIYEDRRDESGEGASTFDEGAVLDGDGVSMARISYNGRVWVPGPYVADDTPLWDNRITPITA